MRTHSSRGKPQPLLPHPAPRWGQEECSSPNKQGVGSVLEGEEGMTVMVVGREGQVVRVEREAVGEGVGYMLVTCGRRQIMVGLRGLRISLGVWRLMGRGGLWLVMMGGWEIGRGVGLIELSLGRGCK